jgi:hypothetical protein
MPSVITQSQAVFEAMKANGGLATLGYLYRSAPRIEGSQWGTKTPFATIRRIVQTDGRFFKIRPGLWALKSEEARLRKQFEMELNAPPENSARFDHSYYQGLLVELGNLQNYNTFVPRQDANRPFLNRKLAQVTTLSDFPLFTYDHVLRKGRTIDVSWFNERGFPLAFYEVEHSTDMYNSLLKFIELQDFRAKFIIVADATRRAEYEDKLNQSAFQPIRKTVEFLDYERLSKMHTHQSELAVLQNQ